MAAIVLMNRHASIFLDWTIGLQRIVRSEYLTRVEHESLHV